MTFQPNNSLSNPLALIPSAAEEDDPPNARKAVNGTAYRIFKLLEWLTETPLSVDALNERFLQDPRIARTLSNDSIWLYINTLKALGCRIRRPGLKNNFRYELLYHPFGLTLSDGQLDTLSQVKAQAQQRFSHQEMLVLDGLFKKIIRHSACDEPDQMTERVFHASRSLDHDACQEHITLLEAATATPTLLELQYLSPAKGVEKFQFMPSTLFYDNGAVYVRGERLEFQEPSNLRVDRILAIQPLHHPQHLTQLIERGSQRQEIRLHVFDTHPDTFQGFGLQAHQGVYHEECRWRSLDTADAAGLFPNTPSSETDSLMSEAGRVCEVRLEVRDWFYLKQRLLASQLRFRVLSPKPFKADLLATLEAMAALYTPEVSHGHR